jgi:hypothetical protein
VQAEFHPGRLPAGSPHNLPASDGLARFAIPYGNRCIVVSVLAIEPVSLCPHRNLDLVFSKRFERTVDKNNTVEFQKLILQIESVGSSWA